MCSSSDSESETKIIATSRLGDCEVCGSRDAIYSCPKCEVKTCCLTCVTIHKKELECDGIRDRTKFIRMKDFTDTDLSSDYRLLEECARFVHSVKRDEKKKFTRIDKDLPVHLFKLKLAARKRGIVLQFLAQNFTRHSINTTRYNFKTQKINWRIEWVFPNAEPDPVKFTDEKCPEEYKLSTLIDKYVNSNAVSFEGSKALTYYKAVGSSGVKALLRAEKVRDSVKKFYELDPTETLTENLSGKCIVEFPIIFVVLKDHALNFDIITPEDEFDYNKEKQTTKSDNHKADADKNLNKASHSNGDNDRDDEDNMQQNGRYSNSQRKRPRQLLTEKIAQEKKLEILKEIKAEKKKKPRNLLFTTGYSSEESIVDSCDDEIN